MRTLLVVNPKATATTPGVREVLAHALASETKLDVVETQARGHAVELARQAVVDGLDVVVALGGDGTVNEVVNGLLAEGPRGDLPALGVVPGGNANVFARALGLPSSPVEATGVLLDGLAGERRREVGLGQADGRWFTFCAGMGLDAAVVRKVEQRRADGVRATPGLFVRQGLQHFFLGADRSEPELVLERPGMAPQPLGLALVCNSDPWTYLGTRPVRPCPQASFDTGLDLFGLTGLGAVTTLRYLRQILSREPRLRGRAVVQAHDVDELVLTARHPVPLQVDGDDLGDRTRVVLRAVPRALSVVV
ncbi:MAG: Diacylglycerol kinase [Frankiales bacterium]|nr:Diacylglycerol kinase [Frankiales bacterium]